MECDGCNLMKICLILLACHQLMQNYHKTKHDNDKTMTGLWNSLDRVRHTGWRGCKQRCRHQCCRLTLQDSLLSAAMKSADRSAGETHVGMYTSDKSQHEDQSLNVT